MEVTPGHCQLSPVTWEQCKGLSAFLFSALNSGTLMICRSRDELVAAVLPE